MERWSVLSALQGWRTAPDYTRLFILHQHHDENPRTQEVHGFHRLGTHELVPNLSLLLTPDDLNIPLRFAARISETQKTEIATSCLSSPATWAHLQDSVGSVQMPRTHMFTKHMPIRGTHASLYNPPEEDYGVHFMSYPGGLTPLFVSFLSAPVSVLLLCDSLVHWPTVLRVGRATVSFGNPQIGRFDAHGNSPPPTADNTDQRLCH